MIMTLPDVSMSVALPGACLSLWLFLWPLYDCDTSWCPSMIVTLPGVGLYDCDTSWDPSVIMTLSGASLWLWHFLGPLYDCDTSLDLPMIVTLPGAHLWLQHILGPLFDSDTSSDLYVWGTSGALFDCDTVGLYDCDTSWDIFIIVTLPGVSLWLSHFLWPLYDCNTSWGLSMIVIFHGGSL